MLEITGTAKHRRVSLLSSQEPLAEQESRIASARPDLYRQRHQLGPHRKSWSWQDLLVQDRGLARLPGQSARPVHHRHGHAQSLARLPDHSLVRKLKAYTEPALLICDELGYLALDQQSSNLFYQVISIRHSQKRSTIITTNTPFSDWGNILFNTTIATAIADRLV